MLVTGGKGEKHMSKRIRYTEGPVGEYKVVKDFLPPPSQLVRKDENVKVTINLSKTSIDFFKSVARDNHVQYQKVIRALLDTYAASYSAAH